MAVAACIKGFNYFLAGAAMLAVGGQRQLGRDTPADKSGKICCNSSRDASNLLYLSLCTKVLCKGRYDWFNKRVMEEEKNGDKISI